MLDWKLYDNTIQKIISNTCKFERLVEALPLYGSWKKKKFNEDEYNKLYPSGSAPSRIYGTPKCTSFPLVINFLSFVQLSHL